MEESIISDDNRIQFLVRFDGFPEITLNKQIRVDIIVNQKLLDAPFYKSILSAYSDFQKAKRLKVYSLESIATDKILAVAELARQEPRDIFDLNYLLKTRKIDYHKIIKRLDKKLGYVIPLSTLISHIKSDVYKKRWQLRLNNQVVDLPHINVVLKELQINLERLYK